MTLPDKALWHEKNQKVGQHWPNVLLSQGTEIFLHPRLSYDMLDKNYTNDLCSNLPFVNQELIHKQHLERGSLSAVDHEINEIFHSIVTPVQWSNPKQVHKPVIAILLITTQILYGFGPHVQYTNTSNQYIKQNAFISQLILVYMISKHISLFHFSIWPPLKQSMLKFI